MVQNGCSFYGLRSEDPNQHLKDFLKLVDSLDLDAANRERMRLRLFQFSLHGQASNWLERLPAGSISTWEDLTTRFLAQFFPHGRTEKLRNDILMFQQHQGESLSEAWTHFKNLLQKVLHHGINLWLQSLKIDGYAVLNAVNTAYRGSLNVYPAGYGNTLAEYMILFGADNRPPMLDKDLYDSWKSRMELYMQNIEHERMILESVENGPLIWPTIEENGVTRTKKYAELSVAEQIQADCDMKATNIILQGLPTDIYSLVNHHRVAKDLWERVQLLMQGFVVPVFSPGDDPIACLNKAMAFLIVVASSRVMLLVLGETMLADKQGLLNATTIKDKAMLAEAQEAGQILDEEKLAFLADSGVPDGQAVQTIIPNNAAFQTEDLDTYDSDCDDISNAQAVLMANISNYGSDVISEVPHSETYLNDMENQSVRAMQDFEQTPAVDFTDNEIYSDNNIIPYSQYLQETQQANEKANKEQNNESVTAELERYKERVKTLEQRLNIDLSICEKMIDSQMDDMIKEKLALKEQVDSFEQNLSKQIKEKECLCKHSLFSKVFKEQFDSIKKTCVRTKEQSDSLIDKLNLKSAENEDLKAQLQDKVFEITSLKNNLRKVKGKKIIDIAAQISSANTIVPRMFKLDLEPLAPRLLQNREAHIDYLKFTQEQADILQEIVKQAKAKQLLDKELDFACKHAQRIQELLIYVRKQGQES
ncbi:uncharacterized mitochondrial protein-like protein [Tanacetum coccineum]